MELMRMKKNAVGQLKLSKETLRILRPVELGKAPGGLPTTVSVGGGCT
jgi:hypothetical protein